MWQAIFLALISSFVHSSGEKERKGGGGGGGGEGGGEEEGEREEGELVLAPSPPPSPRADDIQHRIGTGDVKRAKGREAEGVI